MASNYRPVQAGSSPGHVALLHLWLVCRASGRAPRRARSCLSLLPKCSQLPARGRFPHPASPLPPPDAKHKLGNKSIGGEGAGTLVGRGVITARCPAGFCLGLADVGVCQIPAPIRKNKRQNFPKPPGEPALSCCQFISSSSLNLTTEMGSITAPQNKFFEEKKEQEGISGELQAPTFQRKPLQRPLCKADSNTQPQRGAWRKTGGEGGD